MPFGLDQTTSLMDQDFNYHSLAGSFLAPGRSPGVMTYGDFFKKNVLAYEAGVFGHDGDNARSAQLTDVRTKERAMLFNLAPRPPHIGLLDFASNLINASLDKGYREVRGEDDRGAPQPPPFRKEVGLPHFVLLATPEGDASRSNH